MNYPTPEKGRINCRKCRRLNIEGCSECLRCKRCLCGCRECYSCTPKNQRTPVRHSYKAFCPHCGRCKRPVVNVELVGRLGQPECQCRKAPKYVPLPEPPKRRLITNRL